MYVCVYCVCMYVMYICTYCSRMAQWERAGPMTQRSVDQNYLLLDILSVQNQQNFLYHFYQVFALPLYEAQKNFHKLHFGDKKQGGKFLVTNHFFLLGH